MFDFEISGIHLDDNLVSQFTITLKHVYVNNSYKQNIKTTL